MNSILNIKMKGWEAAMEKKKLKHNLAACWTAVVLNPIWLIVDYLSAPDHFLLIAAVDLPVTAIILGLIIFHKRLNINANSIGVIAIALLSIAAAFVCAQLEVMEFQKLAMSYTAIFIGAGMLVLFEIKHSLISILITVIANIVCFVAFSPLTLQEYMLNGGLLVLLVAIFMAISIKIRYRLTSRGVNSKLILQSKQAELIKAKQVAEDSKELQSQFLSNMSHEIRTPMNGIIGITRILQNTDLSEEQEHYLNAIIQSSENLMVIINDILDFSKIEAGKVVIENRRFDLEQLLQVVQEILIVKAEEKGIYFTVDIDENVPKWIIGDSVRLNQILMNLLSNGIKFTEQGGVNLKVVNTSNEEGEVTLQFHVKDTGIGIPKNKQNDVFQSFTQASSSTTRTHGGTGLGLTITKELVELQEGKIWIESTEGKGSTFSVEIAYEIAENAEESERSLEIQEKQSNELILNELEGIEILLVEDHPINQMLATKVLRDWGFNVDVAENGKICLDMVGQKDYNLILMDISMPEMDGYTATKEIRTGKYNENSELPIVAMTASAFIGENQKCYKAGMNDYISKPFNPQDLLRKIYNHASPNQRRA